MDKKTRNLTLSALFSALAVVSLYVASIWPTGQLGLTAIAALFVAAAVIESGLSFGIYVYIASSLISLLIVPNRISPFLFILLFGHYPIIKSLIEKQGHLVVQILLKLFVFNASITLIWFLFNELFLAFVGIELHPALIYVAGSVVFLLYDYGFTKLIWLYINRVSKSIGSKDRK
jgi:hypothetical protein